MVDDVLQGLLLLFLYYLLLSTAISYIFSPRKHFGNVNGHWSCKFDFQFPVKGFYETVAVNIKDQVIGDIHIDYVEHSGSTSIFSDQRLYMQIRRGDQMILLCAAPFGKGSFISWRAGEPLSFIKEFIPRIPRIGPAMAAYIYKKTYFQMDTDDMFKTTIKDCINEAIKSVSNDQGIRELPVFSQPISIPFPGRPV